MRKVIAYLVPALILIISCKKDNIPSTGTFTDSRDMKSYGWVKIGTQTWMAENMAYLPAVLMHAPVAGEMPVVNLAVSVFTPLL